MKISDLFEDGRVVKGVNTTDDVGPNEIKTQAAKFGNSVTKDGVPPTTSTRVVKEEARYTAYEWAIIEGGHTLEEDALPIKRPGNLFSTLLSLEEKIAPHGSPNEEVQLMMKGRKPAALVYPTEFFKLFQTPAEMYNWVVLPFQIPGRNDQHYVVAQPGETERARRIAELVIDANKKNFFDTEKEEIRYHRELGTLLGYSRQDIEYFIDQAVRWQTPANVEERLKSKSYKKSVGAALLSEKKSKKKLRTRFGEESTDENFADGKNPGRKGLAKRSGVNTKASVSSLRKTAKSSSGEKQRMAHWLANMKAGKAKAKK